MGLLCGHGHPSYCPLSPRAPQEFWVRLLCYIMETDYTEALTPICISLTNLAECQLHSKDVEASTAGQSRHGGQPPCTRQWDWAGGPLRVLGSVPSTISRMVPGVPASQAKGPPLPYLARC